MCALTVATAVHGFAVPAAARAYPTGVRTPLYRLRRPDAIPAAP